MFKNTQKQRFLFMQLTSTNNFYPYMKRDFIIRYDSNDIIDSKIQLHNKENIFFNASAD